MTDTPVQPYGNSSRGNVPIAPEVERIQRYRYGIRVDSDYRGPQQLTLGNVSSSSRDDVMRAARREAEKHHMALLELGIRDAVVPWVQRYDVTTTTTFSEHEDLEAYL